MPVIMLMRTERVIIAVFALILIAMTYVVMYQGEVVAEQREVIKSLYKDCR